MHLDFVEKVKLRNTDIYVFKMRNDDAHIFVLLCPINLVDEQRQLDLL